MVNMEYAGCCCCRATGVPITYCKSYVEEMEHSARNLEEYCNEELLYKKFERINKTERGALLPRKHLSIA